MALPKAAQKQLDDAIKLHGEEYARPEETPPEGSNDNAPAPTNAAAEGQGESPRLSEVQGEAGKADSDPAAKWEHKYNVLKGKYDKEVPRLQHQNNSLQSQLNDMQDQLNELLSRPVQTPESRQSQHLKPEEIEDYGADMIDVVKRAAREEFEPMIGTLREENERLRQLLGGVQQQSVMNVRDRMLEQLDEAVPKWRELNQHPEFLGWLENLDAYSGERRLDMLRQAFDKNNTARVVAFFKGFLNENAAFSTSREPGSNAAPQVGLDTLVAPGRVSGDSQNRAQEGQPGRTWTQAEIQEFYRDVNRGVYRNNPTERSKLENDIFLAQRENRIRE